jgi:hypothetical protein
MLFCGDILDGEQVLVSDVSVEIKEVLVAIGMVERSGVANLPKGANIAKITSRNAALRLDGRIVPIQVVNISPWEHGTRISFIVNGQL